MSKVYTTEITSGTLASDNPIHQRLLKAYVIAKEYIGGQVLEVGCGEGRGVDLLVQASEHFTAVDKIQEVIRSLAAQYPQATFLQMNLPPLSGLQDNAFDHVVSFQVIEHIADDLGFLKEIHRVLKPGGTAFVTTPNRRLSLSRNPWHEREYVPGELEALARQVFEHVTVRGIAGNDKVIAYHEENRKSVQRIMRWDILDLQHRLPARLLRLPYEFLNRWNRGKLQQNDRQLVNAIQADDYFLTDNAEDALDLFLEVKK